MSLSPLAKAYKEQFPGISDEGAELQAMLNRFASSNPKGWKQTRIGSPENNSILLERDNETSS